MNLLTRLLSKIGQTDWQMHKKKNTLIQEINVFFVFKNLF